MLQGEVGKMLEKGSLEEAENPGPGYYSRLFSVQKVSGGWRPFIDLSPLNSYVTLAHFKMEMVYLVLGSIKNDVLSRSKGHLLPDSHSPGFLSPPQDRQEREGLPV